jgi:hypothetical protein
MAKENENSLQTVARLAWDAVVVCNTIRALSGEIDEFRKTWSPAPVENVEELLEWNQIALADLQQALQTLAETSAYWEKVKREGPANQARWRACGIGRQELHQPYAELRSRRLTRAQKAAWKERGITDEDLQLFSSTYPLEEWAVAEVRAALDQFKYPEKTLKQFIGRVEALLSDFERKLEREQREAEAKEASEAARRWTAYCRANRIKHPKISKRRWQAGGLLVGTVVCIGGWLWAEDPTVSICGLAVMGLLTLTVLGMVTSGGRHRAHGL